MRAVVERVKEASIKEDGEIQTEIGRGLLIYLAIGEGDTEKEAEFLINKIVKLRLFPEEGKKHDFQKSIVDVEGEILVVPNYTLYADLSERNRPYFGEAARPKKAEVVYEKFLKKLRKEAGVKVKVKKGRFGAFMNVSAVNDGPVTLFKELRVAS